MIVVTKIRGATLHKIYSLLYATAILIVTTIIMIYMIVTRQTPTPRRLCNG